MSYSNGESNDEPKEKGLRKMEIATATMHTAENLDDGLRGKLTDLLHAHKGVKTVNADYQKPQILIVELDADHVTAQDLLRLVVDSGVQAKMVG